jgi:hypothetical protein
MSFKIGDRVLGISFEDQGLEAIPGFILEGPKNSTLVAALANEEGFYRVEFTRPGEYAVDRDNVPAESLVADTAANRAASAERVALLRRAAQSRAPERRARIKELREELSVLDREERDFGQD